MRQHKMIFLIPSERRLELEQLIEELMVGVEGYRHVGTYEYDPNKPFFINRAAKKVNGEAKPAAKPKSKHEELAASIVALVEKERRPWTRYELAKRLGVPTWDTTKALTLLVRGRKIHAIVRGIYEANPIQGSASRGA